MPKEHKKISATGTTSGFIGFDAVLGMSSSGDAGASPAVDEAVPYYSGSDSELQVALKRLSKKDSTTRHKALRELDACFTSKPAEVLVLVLPLWTFEFPKLCLDNDRRIRALLCTSMSHLVDIVKAKAFAPFIEKLMPSWWSLMHDPAPEVAEAARATFEHSFTPSRQAKLVDQCTPAIIAFLTTQLQQNANALSDGKSCTEAEAEERFERVHCAALGGIGGLATYAAPAAAGAEETKGTDSPASDKAARLVAVNDGLDKSVWKSLSAHQPVIRKAAYSLIVTLATEAPDLIATRAKELAPAVMAAVADTTPSNIRKAMEMLHVVTKAVPALWTHVKPAKSLLPKLWHQLRDGFAGAGQIGYPCVMPLIAQLPDDVKSNDGLMAEFFAHLWKGVDACTTSMDVAALLCAGADCSVYLLAWNTQAERLSTNAAAKAIADRCVGCLVRVWATTLDGAALDDTSQATVHAALTKAVGQLTSILGRRQAASDAQPSALAITNALQQLWTGVHAAACDTAADATRNTWIGLGKALAAVVNAGGSTAAAALGNDLPTMAIKVVEQALTSDDALRIAAGAVTSLRLWCGAPDAVWVSLLDDATLLRWIPAFALQFPRSALFVQVCTDLLRIVVVRSAPSGELLTSVIDSDSPVVRTPEFATAIIHAITQEKVALAHVAALEDLIINGPAQVMLVALHAGLIRNSGIQRLLHTAGMALDQLIVSCHAALAEEHHVHGLAASGSVDADALFVTAEVLQLGAAVWDDHAPQLAERLAQCAVLTAFQSILHVHDDSVSWLPALKQAAITWQVSTVTSPAHKQLVLAAVLHQLHGSMAAVAEGLSLGEHGDGIAVTRALLWGALASECIKFMLPADDHELLESFGLAVLQTHPATLSGTALLAWQAAVVCYSSLLVALEESSHFAAPAVRPYCSWAMLYASLANSTVIQPSTLANVWGTTLSAALLATGTSVDAMPPALGYNAARLVRSATDVKFWSHCDIAGLQQLSITHALASTGYAAFISASVVRLVVRESGPDGLRTLSHMLPIIATALDNVDDAQYPAATALLFAVVPVCVSSYAISLETAPAADVAPLDKNVVVMYTKRSMQGIILDVHRGDAGSPYYTVRLSDGSEIQTERHTLEPVAAVQAADMQAAKILVPLATQLAANLFNSARETGTIAQSSMLSLLALTAVLPVGVRMCGTHQSERLVGLLRSLVDIAYISGRRLFSSDSAVVSEVAWPLSCTWASAEAPVQIGGILCWWWSAACWQAQGGLYHEGLAPLVLTSVWDLAMSLLSSTSDTNAVTAAAHAVARVHTTNLVPIAIRKAAACAGAVQHLATFARSLPTGIAASVGALSSDVAVAASALAQLLTAPCDTVTFSAATPLYKLLGCGVRTVAAPVSAWFNGMSEIWTAAATAAAEAAEEGIESKQELHGADAIQAAEEQEEEQAAERGASVVPTILEQLIAEASRVDIVKLSENSVSVHKTDAARMLVWTTFMQFISSRHGPQRAELSEHATRVGFGNVVLWLCQLARGTHIEYADEDVGDSVFEPQADTALVVRDQVLDVAGQMQADAVSALVASSRALPARLSMWWGALDRATQAVIEAIVVKVVAPVLLSAELQALQSAATARGWDSEEFNVKVSERAGEVNVTYVQDDAQLSIVISLPSTYPLHRVTVACDSRQRGVSVAQWRRWELQMVTVMSTKDGSLIDMVEFWKTNMDKEFSGASACPICYSVLHPTNHQLPRVSCPTCNNRFHGPCLYKWFHTSNKNTCPLCQQPFY